MPNRQNLSGLVLIRDVLSSRTANLTPMQLRNPPENVKMEEYTAAFFTLGLTPEPPGSHLSGLNSSASSPNTIVF